MKWHDGYHRLGKSVKEQPRIVMKRFLFCLIKMVMEVQIEFGDMVSIELMYKPCN